MFTIPLSLLALAIFCFGLLIDKKATLGITIGLIAVYILFFA